MESGFLGRKIYISFKEPTPFSFNIAKGLDAKAA
jgi:hypothetical protein